MAEVRVDNNASSYSKIKELILYISARNAINPKFGKVKLNKILFYSDLMAYFDEGKSITNEDYIKLPFGPVPKNMKDILANMIRDNDISMTCIKWAIDREQHRVSPNRESNLSQFTSNEIAIVERVTQWLWNETANEVSDRSHRFVAWKKVATGDEIPFETAFVCHPNQIIITEESIQRAKQFVEHG